MTEWCASRGIDLTWIEVMPMGDIGNETASGQYLVSEGCPRALRRAATIRSLISTERTGGPARYVAAGGNRPEDRLHHAAQP